MLRVVLGIYIIVDTGNGKQVYWLRMENGNGGNVKLKRLLGEETLRNFQYTIMETLPLSWTEK